MVRDNLLAWPYTVRAGAWPPFANLANAAICGWATQFGTRIWSRFVSYPTAPGFPILSATWLAGPARIIRECLTLPLAVTGKNSTACVPMLATEISAFLTSSAMPGGFLMPVLGPLIILIGATSPLSLVRN